MTVAPPKVQAPDLVPLKRALFSVSDLRGAIALAEALHRRDVSLFATGSTAKAIAAAGLPVTNVADWIGFPEILGGRVKTLHPKIHGGLLALRNDPVHAAEMQEHGIEPFDLVVSNLYPFEETIAATDDYATIVENIDIGGPAMTRAAAKNHGFVSILVDPDDYGDFLSVLSAHDGATTLEARKRWAAKAFARTAAYDAAVSNWFAGRIGDTAPKWRSLGGTLREVLRYGENPHQSAAFYATGENRPGVVTAQQLQGKQLSYNNINDTDAAYELVAEFDPAASAAVAIIKHANPSGVATGSSLVEAYRRALACDPVSAFGGVVALNRTLDAEAARDIVEIFTEVIIAPDASEEAIAIVAAKKNLRLLVAGALPDPAKPGLSLRTVAGGFLAQDRDAGRVGRDDIRVVTKRAPTEAELADLLFAFRIAKHVKSNAIVYAKDGATVGIGAGQMSRVDSSTIAAKKAADAARAAGLSESLAIGSVVASDAFFPFADGLLAAAEAGATAIIQPGGSIRDEDVIAAADAAGLAMVFTGMRHFRH
ncbi:bifunctional phosphoribosylaminoimidazolecarboxamide formyltransferase/inosine monophosphate cyclohydrolase [Kaistia algarum]|uniref:bifunctional phosphoribosylaminoimidazolecarboxamide formyltransferase/IMP cyclohydrolase n=1 Tax=Kaistia algarum TaxID=2083279 RepID=UPI000CE93138|nr:bifunctional phosphoribosylaminoimidazolecarboxamide formyltransferase/IMP cyclohydrolase [Kaistia algarum]MCX5514118.1 bifunctional phosphoribosylaminoimidazolecarboxamide formyltransferase/IMP cyclohydrolase [Kaistia algarum]PPE77313.1 bifunctional phosphoribosylaminoimidazolecarboxamide formyltransferase/inosine monophosphate cyclohydrolase [Kaistia algarum]